MHQVIARVAASLLLALVLTLAVPGTAAGAQCGDAFTAPSPLDPGNPLELYQAALAAMRADRMAEADHLLRSGFARMGAVADPGASVLEPMVMARLVEVAVQRGELPTAMYRMKVLRERLPGWPTHPDWIDAVLKMADLATIRLQNSVAGSDESGACRSLGVAVRSAARIRFDTGSAALDATARADLAQVAHNLLGSGAGRVIVRGHTDARGSDAYNDALSRQRASAVVAQLVALEPALAGRLVAEGAGKREPLYPGDDEESYSLNRRVEFVPAKAP